MFAEHSANSPAKPFAMPSAKPHAIDGGCSDWGLGCAAIAWHRESLCEQTINQSKRTSRLNEQLFYDSYTYIYIYMHSYIYILCTL